MKTSRTVLIVVLAWVFVLAPAASGGAPSAHSGANLEVAPAVSTADELLHVDISGLPVKTVASIELSSTDSQGIRWRSSARFRTDARGRIGLDRTPAVGGSYKGVWGMGLIATLRPTTPSLTGSYVWAGTRPMTFTARVLVGQDVLATRVFTRKLSQRPIRREVERLGKTGFVGEYYAPVGLVKRPAVVAFGGAAGGLRTGLIASMLAARGYPTLALAYFKKPGLPRRLSAIPLEYFVKALTWLRSQPGVDPARMFVLGNSRGSEAALLLGVHFPELVHGVIATVPNNRALCPSSLCTRSPWTLRGAPIPYTRQFNNPHPSDEPSAVIPVERIQGPVFLACAEADRTWDSCPFARAIMGRFGASGNRFRHVLFAAPHAGHDIGSLAPHQPVSRVLAGSPVDERARETAWSRLIAFLSEVGNSE